MKRRVTIVVGLVLGLSLLVAIVAPRKEPTDDPTARTAPVRTGDAGGDPAAGVRGTLPRDKVVRARVGDLVELTVTSREPDSASLEAFGLTDSAERGSPARFSFLADREGSFDVRLGISEPRVVGQVVVRAAKR